MKIALVTGGTRGIGAAISIKLKEDGYKVIANYHNNHDAAKDFSKLHHIKVKPWDVSAYEACVKAIYEISKNYGDIDILVHNAGVTRDTFLHKMSLEKWQTVIQTNLNSCFNITQPLLNHMRERNFGRLIYISSVNGQKGQVGQTNYCAAKAGIIGFIKALSLENASKGITVNAIAPGYISTEMVQAIQEDVLSKIIEQVPQKKLGAPTDVAETVSFLIKSNYITGTCVNVNGGMY